MQFSYVLGFTFFLPEQRTFFYTNFDNLKKYIPRKNITSCLYDYSLGYTNKGLLYRKDIDGFTFGSQAHSFGVFCIS